LKIYHLATLVASREKRRARRQKVENQVAEFQNVDKKTNRQKNYKIIENIALPALHRVYVGYRKHIE
jgi:hypothetical protein